MRNITTSCHGLQSSPARVADEVVEIGEAVGDTIEEHQGEERGGSLTKGEEGGFCSVEKDNLR